MLSSSIPLYLPCICELESNQKPHLSQIKRLYVVTFSELKFKLHPRLRLIEIGGKVHNSEFEMPIFLPENSFICLNFPTLYQADTKANANDNKSNQPSVINVAENSNSYVHKNLLVSYIPSTVAANKFKHVN